MRKYAIIFFGLIVCKLTTSCYPSKGYIVESGIKGRLNNYKNFNISLIPPEMRNRTIEKVLKSRLELQGYDFSDDNPDFFVSYKLFYGTPIFHGYKKENSRYFTDGKNVNPGSKMINDLEEMTVLILFTDYKSGAVVFHSFVSKILCYPQMEDDIRLRTAINRALDQYRFYSTDFYVRLTKKSPYVRS